MTRNVCENCRFWKNRRGDEGECHGPAGWHGIQTNMGTKEFGWWITGKYVTCADHKRAAS